MEIKDRLKSMYYNCSYIDRLKRTLERDREQLGIFPEYLAELEGSIISVVGKTTVEIMEPF